MKTTRMRILEQLETKRFITAIEISNTLQIPSANVRHHLSILLNEGVVEISGQRPVKGRGRPTYLYTLTKYAQRHNLDGLVSAWIEEFLSNQSPEQRSTILHRLACHLVGKKANKEINLTRKLYLAARYLNELGYHSRWEAHAEGPHIILGHCPYAAIVQRYPEICLIDAYIIEELLEIQVEQIEKLTEDTQGLRRCLFLVNKMTD